MPQEGGKNAKGSRSGIRVDWKVLMLIRPRTFGQPEGGHSDTTFGLLPYTESELRLQLQNTDARIRRSVILGMEVQLCNCDETLAALINLLSTDLDVGVREQAAITLGVIGKSNPIVIHALRAAYTDESKRVRNGAAIALGEYSDADLGPNYTNKPENFHVTPLELFFPKVHAKLISLLHHKHEGPKTRHRLRTFQSFLQHGSFRQVAAEEAKAAGEGNEPPDHSGPAARIRRLGTTLEVQLTRPGSGSGLKRTVATEAGEHLGSWIRLHPDSLK